MSGQGKFPLLNNLKQKQAVVNVYVKDSCFKYALLSILHYKDIHQHRGRENKYEQWYEPFRCQYEIWQLNLKN